MDPRSYIIRSMRLQQSDNKPQSVRVIVSRNFIKNIRRDNGPSRRQKSEDRMRFASSHRRQTQRQVFYAICSQYLLDCCEMLPPTTYQPHRSLPPTNGNDLRTFGTFRATCVYFDFVSDYWLALYEVGIVQEYTQVCRFFPIHQVGIVKCFP